MTSALLWIRIGTSSKMSSIVIPSSSTLLLYASSLGLMSDSVNPCWFLSAACFSWCSRYLAMKRSDNRYALRCTDPLSVRTGSYTRHTDLGTESWNWNWVATVGPSGSNQLFMYVDMYQPTVLLSTFTSRIHRSISVTYCSMSVGHNQRVIPEPNPRTDCTRHGLHKACACVRACVRGTHTRYAHALIISQARPCKHTHTHTHTHRSSTPVKLHMPVHANTPAIEIELWHISPF